MFFNKRFNNDNIVLNVRGTILCSTPFSYISINALQLDKMNLCLKLLFN